MNEDKQKILKYTSGCLVFVPPWTTLDNQSRQYVFCLSTTRLTRQNRCVDDEHDSAIFLERLPPQTSGAPGVMCASQLLGNFPSYSSHNAFQRAQLKFPAFAVTIKRIFFLVMKAISQISGQISCAAKSIGILFPL